MSLKLFAAAVVIAAGVALKYGAPLSAVIGGAALAAGINLWQRRGDFRI
jgi:hypothetical protein